MTSEYINKKYLFYEELTKEVTHSICIPQGTICDSETICCVDPTSSYVIGNTPQQTNIINNAGYSPGWTTYISGTSLAGFNAGGGVAVGSMVACVDSGNCEGDNLYRNVYVIGTNGTNSNGGITVRNGPTGSTTGLVTSSNGLQNCTWLINYDTSGIARWVGGIGYTAAATNSSSFYFKTGSVCAYENSVYFNCYGSSINRNFVFRGTTGSIFGLTGFGGLGLPRTTSASPVSTNNAYFTKYNDSGIPIWTNRTANTVYRAESNNSLSCDAYGSTVCQVGSSRGGTGPSQLLVYNGPLGEFVGITGPDVADNFGFIIKYDTSGIAQWMSRITVLNTTGTLTRSTDVSIDEEENIYVCGNYLNDAAGTTLSIFDAPNGSTIGLTGPGEPIGSSRTASYLAKFNPSGKSLWFKKFAATLNNVFAQSVSYANKSVYVSGIYLASPITIYEGPAPSNILLTATNGVSGTNDAFVSKFDSNGNPEWVGRISSEGDQDGDTPYNGTVSVDATSEGCYVNCTLGIPTGTAGILNIYNGPTGSGTPAISVTYPGVSGAASIVVKYNSKGEAQWVVRFAQTGGSATGYHPWGISASRNGIYFLTYGRTFATTLKTFTYFNRNLGLNATRSTQLPFASFADGIIINRIDFSDNEFPTFAIYPNNTELCPTAKTITYKTDSNKTSVLDPSGLVYPNIGLVSGITANASGATLKLLYNPTSTTDWFITQNTGFGLY